MLFTAATATLNATRNLLIQQVHNMAASNQSNSPFCVAYDPTNGTCHSGQNSPAQGAMFALLALKSVCNTIPSFNMT